MAKNGPLLLPKTLPPKKTRSLFFLCKVDSPPKIESQLYTIESKGLLCRSLYHLHPLAIACACWYSAARMWGTPFDFSFGLPQRVSASYSLLQKRLLRQHLFGLDPKKLLFLSSFGSPKESFDSPKEYFDSSLIHHENGSSLQKKKWSFRLTLLSSVEQQPPPWNDDFNSIGK